MATQYMNGVKIGTTAPPPGSPGAAGTGTLDRYLALISGDPFYQQTVSLLSAQAASDAARRQEAIRRAIIEFGIVPEGYSDTDIDAATRALAEQNTGAGLSIWSRLQHAADLNKKHMIDQLGARGMLQSGETGFQLGELNLQAGQANYDAGQALLDALRGFRDTFTSNEFGRQAAWLDAIQQAYSRQSAMGQNVRPQGQPVPGSTAPRPTQPPWGTL